MHKKTPNKQCLTEKRPGKELRSTKAAGQHQRASNAEPGSQLNGQARSRSSGNWDHDTDRSSWSEDIDDAASGKILEQWHIVQRTLFDEPGQLGAGPLFDECLQWRNQLPHLRILGRRVPGPGDRDTRGSGDGRAEVGARSQDRRDKANEPGSFERNIFSRDESVRVPNHQNRRKMEEEVLDHIVEFICKELAEIEAEKEAENLSGNFDEYLKITPAPTCTGKNPLISNNFPYNIENNDKEKSKEKTKKKDKEATALVKRNKLGTVFNERIIVSPVPFIATTRESFSTIRRTPIQFHGEAHDDHNGNRFGSKYENTSRKLSLNRKTPFTAVPHARPSWNMPVCPTVWPKNIKLTPIDTSRLPSSKHRTSRTAESVPPPRNRHSLSPISHLVHSSSSRNCINSDNHAGLEIRGLHIEAQVPQLSGKAMRTKLMNVKRTEGV